ncbi:translation initiation factor IF-2 N-terminal domain-containing protein [Pseudonocardia aurantiaca]|uniref:Translation initiation factor IF-2 N-terminal domain-containing protein n=2 Tax=Pseudonocardia aurantiaca TaxID=75290 RepID=A0ABW4FLF3_9PSEU
MSNNDSPAGGPGGPVTVPPMDDLPERMRVHALAKLLSRTSREILAALAGLGLDVRSAQSSIDRKAAEQVVTALAPGSDTTAERASAPPAAPAEDAPAAESSAPLAPLFAPPTPLFQPPTRPSRFRRRAAEADAPTPEPEKPEQLPSSAAEDTPEPQAPDADIDGDGDGDGDDAGRRRRRRGRRGRGRGRGADGYDDENDENGDDAEDTQSDAASDGESASDEDADTDADADAEQDTDAEDDDEGAQADGETAGSRRRRRVRRRRGSDDNDAAADDSDGTPTVTRVRAPRERSDDEGDGVQSVRGSTRLEAKRQRRRDGRDAGRRRTPILSEAEFLARRESVDRAMVVREHGDRVEIAVLEDDVLVEHFVAGRNGGSMVGNIYLGRVQNVLPSMEAAFVDIGRGRNAVLYAGEVDWDAAGLGGKARRIEQALSSGDSVLVQVTKDPIGHKGARLTTQISLAGRFLVYVPSGGAAGISRKLPDVERKRLKDMLKEIVPSEAGVIIRTASEGVSQEALERDVRRLQAQWEVVKGKAETTGPNRPKAPTLLYEEPDLLLKVVRDQFNEDFSRLVVEGADAWDTLQNYVGHVAPELAGRLHRHVGPKDVFAEYRIDEQLLKALDRKVWLPSGGTLVIDRTEAMTVIDVNTGKFTGSGGNLEETVTRNNLEAAEEVVRQLRLRDIGGIIVVDFIDMVLEANRDLVLRRLTECLARDRTRHQVAEVTSLGLVQMTRKRVGGGLLEHFSTPCEHCRGRGVIVDADLAGNGNGHTNGHTAGHPNGHADRGDRSDRDGPRSRRGKRGDDDRGERGGRDRQTSEGEPDGVGRGRPDLPAPADPDASVDVGAPDPMVEAPAEAVVEASVVAPEPSVAEAPAAPIVDVQPPAVETPVGGSRRVRRRGGAVASAPAESQVDVAADAVEEVVVERSVAERAEEARSDAAQNGVPADAPAADVPGAVAPEATDDEEPAPRPRARRRGRVTRTAGAPVTADGDAPVAVVLTVPAPSAADATATDIAVEPAVPVSAPPQPEPTGATRPRRARRAASRPAGPPAETAAGDDA